MSDKNSHQDPNKYLPIREGFFQDIMTQIKLILRLMADDRVNGLYKLLPLLPMIYFIVPDPVLGPVDDVALLWLGSYFFIELCPPEVVQEHLDAIHGRISTSEGDENIIDAEFRETD